MIGYDGLMKPELLVWQMNDEGQFTLIHQESLKISGGRKSCEMDDQYVAIKSKAYYDEKNYFHFFSWNTMKIVSSLNEIPTEDSYAYVYGSGLLFNLREGYVR